MCIKAADKYPSTIKFVPDWFKSQECVLDLLILVLLYLTLFLVNIPLKERVIKLLMIMLMH